MQVAR
jgi:hypothetical protein